MGRDKHCAWECPWDSNPHVVLSRRIGILPILKMGCGVASAGETWQSIPSPTPKTDIACSLNNDPRVLNLCDHRGLKRQQGGEKAKRQNTNT